MKLRFRGAGVSRWLGPGTIAGVVLGYGVDALLLWGFAAAGSVRGSMPVAYMAAALVDCTLFRHASRTALRSPARSQSWYFLHLIVATAIQLTFAALAPQLAFYFVSVLLVAYGAGSMSVSALQSALTWIGAAIAAAFLITHVGDTHWVPHADPVQRMLVWLCFVSMLGRFILLGVLERSQLLEPVGGPKVRDRLPERVDAELQHQATHDALTGLANRVLFADRLEQAVAAARPFAVCVMDLDRFKIINDSFGHGAGDALLKLVGRRLLSTIRSEDTVARAGGDEFLLLLNDIGKPEELEKLAQRWMSALSDPYRIQGAELHVSPSVGIARYPVDATDGEELLARADEAMCQAKQHGRNSFRFYDAEVMGCSRERLAIEADLRRALAGSQLQLNYQPKIDIHSGEIRSVEALLRWQHPTRGEVAPGEFIPIAEDTGLILPIGEWVIHEACRQARAWQLQGLPSLRVAVNISPIQFRQPAFAHGVRAALAAYSLDASYLELELTEATLMSNAERSVAMLEQLSRLGVAVAIDDFGTGYSSMLYLQRFPIDKLKIDRSFICDLGSDTDDASIVRAIISLAHGLRLKVVAEGVESAAQLAILRRMGCDQYQGFLHSAAVPPQRIAALLGEAPPSSSPVRERTFGKITRLVRHRL